MALRLNDNEGQLARAVKTMEDRWAGTAGEWRDKAREDFDKEYLEDLRQQIRAAQQAMKAVAELLRQVMRECGN